MARRRVGIKGFADMVIADIRKPTVLDKFRKIIDFEKIGKGLEEKLHQKSGRPSYPAEIMIKVILLQVMCDLSDERMQEVLADRLSFRRFCDFSVEDITPDNATICWFRGLLKDLDEGFLETFNHQLDLKGMRLRKGTLVDATIIKSNSENQKGSEISQRDPEGRLDEERRKFPSWE